MQFSMRAGRLISIRSLAPLLAAIAFTLHAGAAAALARHPAVKPAQQKALPPAADATRKRQHWINESGVRRILHEGTA